MSKHTYQIESAYKNNWLVEAKFKEYYDVFNVELTDLWSRTPDCKVGHFGYNFYFRTPYGIKSKMYKNWSTLIKAINKVAKRHNLTLEYLEVNKHLKMRLI